jgi:hypothetical protein
MGEPKGVVYPGKWLFLVALFVSAASGLDGDF